MKRGFTLIEVLTTILIFGILVSITSYVYGKSLERSRDTQRVSDLRTIKNALEQYYLEERAYPINSYYNAPNAPWVAKYELESYKTHAGTCSNSSRKTKYLAPNFITSLPEDPRYLMVLNAACDLDPAVAPIAGYGQYLYVSLVADKTELKPKEYYLMARLEREKPHVSPAVPTVDSTRYGFTATQIFPTSQLWGYTYCAENSPQGPTDPTCSYNYYLKNSNND